MEPEVLKSLLAWSVILVLYLLRKLPVFDKIWYIVKLFFIILIITLAADYAKDKIKEWWNK